MALAWVLRDSRITTVLIGASSVAQLDQNLACLEQRSFSSDELVGNRGDPTMRGLGGIVVRSSVMLLAGRDRLRLRAPVQASSAPVMSFNIRGDFDLEQATDSSEAWNSLSNEHRRDLVVKTIDDVDPDVFGVQEAFQHQLVDLKTRAARLRVFRRRPRRWQGGGGT